MRIQEVGHVKVHQHRPVAGRVKTVPVEREGRKRFVVLTAEQAAPDPLPTTGSVAGIDLGTAAKNRPTQDTFHCTVCGHTAHADTAGAPNALRAGPARPVAKPNRHSGTPLSGGGGVTRWLISASVCGRCPRLGRAPGS
ncbi:hypothetical protein GCM10018966_094630 [Streptomyces yanii]